MDWVCSAGPVSSRGAPRREPRSMPSRFSRPFSVPASCRGEGDRVRGSNRISLARGRLLKLGLFSRTSSRSCSWRVWWLCFAKTLRGVVALFRKTHFTWHRRSSRKACLLVSRRGRASIGAAEEIGFAPGRSDRGQRSMNRSLSKLSSERIAIRPSLDSLVRGGGFRSGETKMGLRPAIPRRRDGGFTRSVERLSWRGCAISP